MKLHVYEIVVLESKAFPFVTVLFDFGYKSLALRQTRWAYTWFLAFGFPLFPYIEADLNKLVNSETKSFRNEVQQVRENKIRWWCLTKISEIKCRTNEEAQRAFHNDVFCICTHCMRVLVMGPAIAQAVSRRLPTAAAWVRAQVRSCGICDGQNGIGAGFLRVLGVPLQILIPPTAPHSSSIIRGWHNRSISGRRTKWTQPHPIPRN
jgi:hypothetical protein